MLSSFPFDAFDRLATEQFDDLLGERGKMIGKFLILQIADELGLVGILANLLRHRTIISRFRSCNGSGIAFFLVDTGHPGPAVLAVTEEMFLQLTFLSNGRAL